MNKKGRRSSNTSKTRRYGTVSDETRLYKTDSLSSKNNSTVKNNSKSKGKKTKKNKKQKSKAWRIIKKILIALLILGILAGLIVAGIIAGIFLGLFGDDFKMTKDDLLISFSNSEVYDADGNLIATLSGNEKRKIISMSEMPEYLPKAYVAIEDERFYSHSGVDIKRTGAATITYLFHRGNSSFGGSTITQQLVKNITKEDEDSAMRKVKEMARAIQVEKEISKDNILELYLNVIFVGGNNINGVALGSEYYFNKNVKDLDLAECAFLAGINHSPNKYNPFENMDDAKKKMINDRTKTVLDKMRDLGYASKEDYDAAYAKLDGEGLPFSQGNLGSSTIYSYHTEAAINEIINQLMEEKDMSRDMAETTVYGGGLKIYTTQKPNVQSAIDEEMKKEKYQKASKKNPGTHSQAAIVVIDHTTGKVVGVGGQLGEKTTNGDLNRGTQTKRQVGSAMKPLSVIAPAVNEGIISPASVYKDEKTTFPGNYTPENYYHSFHGPQTVREAITISGNIIPLKILQEVGVEKSIDYLRKMGITTIDDNEGLSIGLGGLRNGASVLEIAGAYATIANDGTYIEPTFYSEVKNASDEVILTPNQETREVLDKSSAYIVKSIVTAPVVGAGGTATYCAIPNMDVAAKTGTTDDNFDRWLCGFTPYYTAATWFGYDQNEKINYDGSPSNPAGGIWDGVMTAIHTGLPGKRFDKPADIVQATVCKDSGLLPSEGCTNLVTDIFISSRVPTKHCSTNSRKYQICVDSGLLAIPGVCPNVEEKSFVDEEDKIPTQMCNIHKQEETPTPSASPSSKPQVTPSSTPPTSKPTSSPSPSPSTPPTSDPATKPSPSPSEQPPKNPDTPGT